ncbi:MAG: shikimate dehydrogenase [Candidatus Hydrogenedentota bacterium]
MIDVNTQLCGVIGNPVGHSLSPAIHNAGYAAQGLNFVYLAFEVSDVKSVLDGMRAMPNFRGLSVTIPHKLAVIEHLDEIDPLAEKIGSVNTITNDGGKLIGSSTDGPGTLMAFEDAGFNLSGKRVLMLGAGGAVRAVAFAMAEVVGDGCVTLAGRNLERVEPLAQELQSKTDARIHVGHLVNEIATLVPQHDVIVQGTPIGMHPESVGQSCVPEGLLRAGHVVFDMVYRPLRTKLIEDAEAAGCQVILGSEMLVQQAAVQYGTWTGMDAPVDVMRKAFLAGLTE